MGERCCRRTADTELVEHRPRLSHGAVDVDASAGVFNDERLKSLAVRILRRITDAEIKGETGQKDAPKVSLAQVTGKASMRDMVVLIKGRVGIDFAVVAFAQHQLGMRDA